MLRWLTRGFLAWFVVYLVLQGENGFFAVTADNVESVWVQLLFLNIPLQLALTLTASFGLAERASRARTRFALGVAAANALLVMTHVGLSIATA